MRLWPKKNKEKVYPKENEVYEFLDLDGSKIISAIRVIDGEFKGVIYHYGTVEVVEEDPPRIKFDYFIDNEGDFELDDLKYNKNFDTLMGDILVSIFDNNILKKEKVIDESFRVVNPEKSDLQWRIYP